MSAPRLAAIVAMARNGVIGRDNELPWRLSEDLKRFKRVTLGKPVIMGRKTWDSIGKALPGRLNIVVTRQNNFQAEGAMVVHSLAAAIAAAAESEADESMLIGGATLYAEAMPLLQRIYLTRVDADIEGDARFPDLDPAQWRESQGETFPADEKNEHPTHYAVLDRA